MIADEILSKLDILPLDKLLGHEQTIKKNEIYLKEAMLNIGKLVDPIIVDKEHHVVLDGNHRFSVLKAIQCVSAACQVVDYDDEEIKVGGWLPTTGVFPSAVGKLKCEIVDFEAGKAAVDNKQAYFMAMTKTASGLKCCLYASGGNSLDEIIADQQAVLKGIGAADGMGYIEDFKCMEAVDSGRTVLYRRNFTKSEIVAKAKTGVPLPPKSTRHSIPDRIIRLNLPLGWLMEDDIVTARQHMAEMIKKRAADFSIRRYTEPVLVIY
ncbi:MAG: hypothetical protein WC506_06480 [Candidatus Micrarchaeia archaeon]